MSQGTDTLKAIKDARVANKLELVVFDDLADVPGQHQAWNDLVDVSTYPNVFLRWEWIDSWWKWFGEGRELYLIVVQDNSRIMGIVPLYRSSVRCGYAFHGTKLTFIGAGGPTCPEYLGPIVHRDFMEPVIESVAHHIQTTHGKWNVLEFPDITSDDRATNKLIDRLCLASPSLSCPGEVCLCLDLPESYDALLGRLSSHNRQRKKRQLRRAKEECEVRLDLVGTQDAADAAFEIIKQLSSSSRRRAGQVSPFLNAGYAGFHQEVIAKLFGQGITRIYLLYFHGTPVGFLYGFLHQDKYYAFQTGFDSGLERYSPGDVLYQMVFQNLISLDAREFDYLRGEESYKKFFANGERRTETTLVFPNRSIYYLNQWLRTRVYSKLRSWVKRSMDSSRKGK